MATIILNTPQDLTSSLLAPWRSGRPDSGRYLPQQGVTYEYNNTKVTMTGPIFLNETNCGLDEPCSEKPGDGTIDDLVLYYDPDLSISSFQITTLSGSLLMEAYGLEDFTAYQLTEDFLGNGQEGQWGAFNQGNDTIIGSKHSNFIYGGFGSDTIIGGNGNDVIRGGLGNDVIDGGKGNDSIYSGEGQNQLTGGKGNDLFALSDNGFASIIKFSTKDDAILLESGRSAYSINPKADSTEIIFNMTGNKIAELPGISSTKNLNIYFG